MLLKLTNFPVFFLHFGCIWLIDTAQLVSFFIRSYLSFSFAFQILLGDHKLVSIASIFVMPELSFYSSNIVLWFRSFSLSSETKSFSLWYLSLDSSLLMFWYLKDCSLEGGISVAKENRSSSMQSFSSTGDWIEGLWTGRGYALFKLFTDATIFTSIARGILMWSTNDGENIGLAWMLPLWRCSINACG